MTTITPADIETWRRVEAAIQGKALELCAAHCEQPPRPCRGCSAASMPQWRGSADIALYAANQE